MEFHCARCPLSPLQKPESSRKASPTVLANPLFASRSGPLKVMANQEQVSICPEQETAGSCRRPPWRGRGWWEGSLVLSVLPGLCPMEGSLPPWASTSWVRRGAGSAVLAHRAQHCTPTEGAAGLSRCWAGGDYSLGRGWCRFHQGPQRGHAEDVCPAPDTEQH